jgi:DNA-binding response OmpR family regulator
MVAAEDDWLLAEVVVTALHKAGCKVIGPAPRLAKVIELVERSDLDVALLDIDLNGETCYPAAWRRLLERKVPFAFMTAYSPSYVPQALAFVAVLAKPFDEGELLAMVEKSTRRDVSAALGIWSPDGQLPSDPRLPQSG